MQVHRVQIAQTKPQAGVADMPLANAAGGSARGTLAWRRLLKQRMKQVVRASIGEPHVGKRMKTRWLETRLPELAVRHPQHIIDVGCEDATFVYWLARRFPDASITGLDIDREAVEACRAAQPRRLRARVDFRAADLATLPAGAYDLATAFDVLEHIPDDTQALRQILRVLRPGGLLAVHVPALPYTDQRGRKHWVADEDAWRINAGHVRHGYEPETLRTRVIEAGFDVLTVERWNRHWSAWAHYIYDRLEHPTPLRLLTVPITDALAWLDRRRPAQEGNTVWLVAQAPCSAQVLPHAAGG